MNTTFIKTFWVAILLSLTIFASQATADVYRIGYIEGGHYWAYDQTMAALKKSLKKRLWEKKLLYPDELSYSPGWGNEKQKELASNAKTLMNRMDVDLIVAAGTEATKAILKVNNNRTPILAISVPDPLKSGFVMNENDSGANNFFVRIVPDRYTKMFRTFHDIVSFKKLGIMYPDTEVGMIYSNVADARKVALEKGFKVIEYKQISREESGSECLAGIEALIAQGMDAFYIPSLNCFDWTISDVDKILKLLIKKRIPTFALEGSRMVKAGAMLGFSSYDIGARGEFLADRMIRILEGATPRNLEMIHDVNQQITLNLFVAKKIRFRIPPFYLRAARKDLYKKITLPDDRMVK